MWIISFRWSSHYVMSTITRRCSPSTSMKRQSTRLSGRAPSSSRSIPQTRTWACLDAWNTRKLPELGMILTVSFLSFNNLWRLPLVEWFRALSLTGLFSQRYGFAPSSGYMLDKPISAFMWSDGFFWGSPFSPHLTIGLTQYVWNYHGRAITPTHFRFRKSKL